MTLKQDIKKTQQQVADVAEQVVPSGQVTLPLPARSYTSASFAYDNDIGFNPPTRAVNITTRPMWRTQDVAIQQNKVITTKLPDAEIASGQINSPSVTSANLVAVPDMAVALNIPGHSGDVNKGGGQVQVSWHLSAMLSSAAAQASFALFRDGVKVGPVVYGGTPNANGKFSVAQNFIDTPGNGVHSYAVYWATTAGTLTADAQNRYIHALALRPE